MNKQTNKQAITNAKTSSQVDAIMATAPVNFGASYNQWLNSVTCPACGHWNRDGSNFCGQCGTKLA